MIRQALSFTGLLFLAGAATLATPGSGLAQHHGGGHFGGGHFGGGQFGGFHSGFYNGRAHYGYPYYRPFYGYYPYSYGYYPYYSGYSTDYSSDNTYPDAGPGLAYDPAGNSQSLYLPATAATQADTLAHVTVRVPADARVWFENTPTTSTGPVREFNSPPLTPGSRYTYDVRATWNENGHEVTQTQQVGVTAGARVAVDFPVKPESTGQPSVTPTR